MSSDGRARPGAVGGEAGGHPGREHEGGMDLLQGCLARPVAFDIDPHTVALSISLGIGSSSQRDLLGQPDGSYPRPPPEPGPRIAGNMVGATRRAQPTSNRPSQLTRLPPLLHLNNLRLRVSTCHTSQRDITTLAKVLRSRLEAAAHMRYLKWQAPSRAKPFTSRSLVSQEGWEPRPGLGVAMVRRRLEAVLVQCGAVSVQRAGRSVAVIRRVVVPLRLR